VSRWVYVPLIAGLALGAACAHRVRSSPHAWQLRGAVVSVNDTTFQVRHKSGGIVDLQIDDETSFVKNDRADSRRSLLRGTRVVVEVDTIQRGVYRARLVRIFGGGRPNGTAEPDRRFSSLPGA
jgi:hypothetical protein